MIKIIDKGENVSLQQEQQAINILYCPSFLSRDDIKVKQAVLQLDLNFLNKNLKYEVLYLDEVLGKSYTVDIIDGSSAGRVCVDISDELQTVLSNKKASANFKIVNAGPENVEILSNSAKVFAENYSKKEPFETASYDFDCKRAGKGRVNLFTGELEFVHNDLAGDQSVLPIKIDHVYNNFLARKNSDEVNFENGIVNFDSFGCGKGFKLNFQQYLVKERVELKKSEENAENNSDLNQKEYGMLSDGKSAGKFTYIDAMGKHIEFLERFSYVDNLGNTVYLKASEVKIMQDGKLSAIENSKNGEALVYNTSEGKMVSVKHEFVSNSKLGLTTRFEDIMGLELIEQDIEEIANLKAEIKNIEDGKKEIENNILSLSNNKQLALSSKEINKLNYENQKLSLANESQFIAIEKGRDKSEYTETMMANRERSFDINCQVAELTSDYNKEQFDYQNSQVGLSLEVLNSKVKQYDILLQKKVHQLKLLQNQVPVHYLTSDDGLVLGFGLTEDENIYRLVVIADNYENAVYISYDENNKISSIKTTDSKTIDFVYEDRKSVV